MKFASLAFVAAGTNALDSLTKSFTTTDNGPTFSMQASVPNKDGKPTEMTFQVVVPKG